MGRELLRLWGELPAHQSRRGNRDDACRRNVFALLYDWVLSRVGCRFVKHIGQGRKKRPLRGRPKKGTHGTGVAQALVRSFLPAKVEEGIKTVRAVKALLGFSVAALHLSVVPGRIGADEPNSQLSGRCLKEGFQVTLAAGKAIGEFKTVIGLNTLDGNAFAGKMLEDFA